ncbi:hypothetical protein E2C01_028831 [Portunus trituberculatus]|uniref:Uncharacterized protein n=1 Tax=Portunus trituberculatus TaxID=210409 RepID=A0A5B7EQJ9_PORTR|nr:hypothetical protein [Portunus trituberculatus]
MFGLRECLQLPRDKKRAWKYLHQHRQCTHLPTFAIMNGSVSVIGEGHNSFIYCIANLHLACRVAWTDPDGTPLPTYTPLNPPSTNMDVV